MGGHLNAYTSREQTVRGPAGRGSLRDLFASGTICRCTMPSASRQTCAMAGVSVQKERAERERNCSGRGITARRLKAYFVVQCLLPKTPNKAVHSITYREGRAGQESVSARRPLCPAERKKREISKERGEPLVTLVRRKKSL